MWYLVTCTTLNPIITAEGNIVMRSLTRMVKGNTEKDALALFKKANQEEIKEKFGGFSQVYFDIRDYYNFSN